MNHCYSLFSVAMMTAACASASRRPPTHPVEAEPQGDVASKAKPETPAATSPLERDIAAEDPDERTIRELRQAASLFESFIAKADGDPKYADAVARSRERIDDIRVEIRFLTEGMAARRGQ